MLQQLVNLIQGQMVEWLLSFGLLDGVWELLARAYQGIGTLIAWTPPFPYMPYAALNLAVTIVIASWLSLFGIGMVITWATKLKP